MAPGVLQVCRLAVPLAAAAAAAWLASRHIAPGVDLDSMTRGIVGPATWPRTTLYCASLFAAAIFARNLWVHLFSGRAPQGEVAVAAALDPRRAALGAALIIAYAVAMPWIGIAWATLAFLVAWMALGGVRRPLLIALVAGSGTLVILYLFVKASRMPLDRGVGAVEQATIALYRLLRIY